MMLYPEVEKGGSLEEPSMIQEVIDVQEFSLQDDVRSDGTQDASSLVSALDSGSLTEEGYSSSALRDLAKKDSFGVSEDKKEASKNKQGPENLVRDQRRSERRSGGRRPIKASDSGLLAILSSWDSESFPEGTLYSFDSSDTSIFSLLELSYTDSLQVQELQEELRTMKERGVTLVDVLDHALETMDCRGTRVISSNEFDQVVNAIKRAEFCSGLIEEYEKKLLKGAEGSSKAKGEKSLFSKLRTIVSDVKKKLASRNVVLLEVDGTDFVREIESPLQKSHSQPLEDADGKDKTYGRRRSSA